jgi:hypothetical protein
MKEGSLNDKERKLIAAARREAEAKRAGAAPQPAKPAAPVRAPTSPLDGRTVVGWDPLAAHVTPLDQPTVAGWDHPAASGAKGEDADGKWSRMAALMESERAEGMRKRQRAKRRAAIFMSVLLVVVAFVAARVLLAR